MITIAWIGFCQSLFAAILMFTKKESSLSDKVLSGFLTLLSIEFLTCIIDYLVFGEPLLSSSFLLFNPALFLYIRSLTRPTFALRWIQLLHFLPFIVFEIIAYVIQEPFSMDVFFVNDKNFIYRMFFTLANLVSWSVYNPLSLILVHRHRVQLHDERSTISKNENLGWVLAISIFYVVYCSIAFIISIVIYFMEVAPLSPHIYNYSVLLFVVFVFGFYGLRQQLPEWQLSEKKEQKSYRNSYLSVEMKQQIKKRLLLYFEKEQPWQQPELNMDGLSEAIKVPKHQLTETLNTHIGMNFFSFVNSYRVEAVKKMLSDPNNKFSIEAIGYECGFASKSAFYTVFKKITGETPMSYRELQI